MTQSRSRRWKILGRHKWVVGAIITESCDQTTIQPLLRYTATIRGWRNWRIWQGDISTGDLSEMTIRVREIKRRVEAIRDRIDRGDETVFHEPGAW